MPRVLSRDDPVSNIRGCGKTTREKLSSAGIFTVGQLLNYGGTIEGIKLKSLKSTAKLRLAVENVDNNSTTTSISTGLNNNDNNQNGDCNYPCETNLHSWFELTSYVCLSKGRIRRVTIKNLVFEPTLRLVMKWKEGGKWRKVLRSPQTIMCTHVLWMSSYIVSSDSSVDETSEANDVAQTVTKTGIDGGIHTSLPKFRLLGDMATTDLNDMLRSSVTSVIQETDQLQEVITANKLCGT